MIASLACLRAMGPPVAQAVPLGTRDVATHNQRGVELSAQGRHREAIAEFEKALHLAPTHPVVRRNLAHAYGNLATQLLRKRAFQKAANQYQAAIELSPEELRFYMGLGVAFLGLQEVDHAVEAFSQARDLNPQNVEPYRYLGEAYYRQGDLDEAVRTWEEGLRVRPGDQELKRRIAQVEGEQEVHESYERQTGAHFALRYVGEVPEELSREILELLERAYDEVGYDLNHYPRNEVEVVIYSDADFQRVTHLPVWVAAAYEERGSRIRIPIRGIKEATDLRALLYHEYTHVVIRDVTGGKVPTWLNEGLALIEQRTPLDGAVETVRQLADERKLPSLGSLNGSFVGLTGAEARMAYAVSYTATKFLIERWSRWDTQRLLRQLGEGVPFEKALEDATRLTVPEFEQEWRDWLVRGY
ncbi:MAG: tetratricopeptide repeat protein [Candidatus Methylomirabilales bacterium]